ncbi:MAG: hypothetical protein K2J88_06335 [Oscillospiraceae bacterium]|nr:hypothetical protein [Oscillospiraceae bacterium]
MRNIQIGDYLVEQKLITQEQLNQVLAKQKENSEKHFDEIIVELGFISEVSFSQACARILRVPYVDLEHIKIEKDAVRRIPENFAKKNTVIAISVQGSRLLVATNDPINLYVLEDIKMQTGMDALPVMATKSAITKTIDSMYCMINK